MARERRAATASAPGRPVDLRRRPRHGGHEPGRRRSPRTGSLPGADDGAHPGKHAIIVDTPQSIDPPACLSSNINNVWNCATPRNRAFNWRYLKLERTAAADSGATLIDLTDDICPGDPCPAVLRGMIVYRDVHHLTETPALSLADRLERLLPNF